MTSINPNAIANGIAPLKKREVLLIAYYFPPENAAGSARPHRFYKYLPEFGYATVVLAPALPGQHSLPRVHRTPANHSGVLEPLVHIGARMIQRLTGRYSDRLPWLPVALKAASELLTESVTAVISTHPPIVTHLAAWRIKKQYGVSWIADFRDPVYSPGCKGSPVYAQWLEQLVFRNADRIIANTEQAASMWRSRYPEARQRIHTIWNGYDPEECVSERSLPRCEVRSVAHVGDIYGRRNPAVFLRSLDRLFATGALNPNTLRVRLIGPMDDDSETKEAPEFRKFLDMGVLECTPGLVPRTEALHLIAESDYLLLLDMWPFDKNVQVSGKIFDYVRGGRPIIAFTTPDSPAEWILQNSGLRYECVFPNDTDEAVDRKTYALLSSQSSRTPFSKWFAEKFDGRLQTKGLATLLDDVCGSELGVEARPTPEQGSR